MWISAGKACDLTMRERIRRLGQKTRPIIRKRPGKRKERLVMGLFENLFLQAKKGATPFAVEMRHADTK